MKQRPAVAILLLPAAIHLGCDALSDAVSEDPENLLVLTVNPESIPADGASTSTLTARVPAGALPEDRIVTFSTSAGTFVDGSIVSSEPIDVPADVHGVAAVQLRSGLSGGAAIVRAEAGTATRKGRVNFTLALPQQVIVTADTYLLSVGSADTTDVEALLYRSQGVASAGLPVEWTAVDPGGAAVGGFSSQTASDSSGKATAEYSPGTTAFRGVVTIRALVRDPSSGASVQGETAVELVD
jgi:hypothetical protein